MPKTRFFSRPSRFVNKRSVMLNTCMMEDSSFSQIWKIVFEINRREANKVFSWPRSPGMNIQKVSLLQSCLGKATTLKPTCLKQLCSFTTEAYTILWWRGNRSMVNKGSYLKLKGISFSWAESLAILGPDTIANRGSKVAFFLTDIGLLELQEGKTRVKDWICETNQIQCLSLTLHLYTLLE